MKIPKEIQIIGRKIKIEYDSEINRESGNLGESHYHKDLIKLCPINTKSRYMTNQELEISFLHELLHWILLLLQYKEENNDEFIERFSEVLYQVIKQIED